MYKLFLSLRYLKTRWIALASIVSVMLGVATLVVVNCVMKGFTTEMKTRIQGVLADVVVERLDIAGFELEPWRLEKIEEELGDSVVAVTPVLESFGLLVIDWFGNRRMQPVTVFAIRAEERCKVSPFEEHLADLKPGERPSFKITPQLQQIVDQRRALEEFPITPRPAEQGKIQQAIEIGVPGPFDSLQQASVEATPDPDMPENPFGDDGTDPSQPLIDFDHSSTEQDESGIIIPWLLATYRDAGKDYQYVRPGDEVTLILPTGAGRIEPRFARRIVVNRFKSGMSEYDQSFCYMDLEDLQRIRQMEGRVTSLHIRLRDFSESKTVVKKLQRIFPFPFAVSTWEQKQGPLMAAVEMETSLLNLLLFMIIAVAGFGILAIFFMIVVEKTRDIGILKALGASDRGVLGIFLSYGLGLGVVGSGLGMAMGLLIVVNLDTIEKWLSLLTGREVFDRDLYYFDKIPAVIDPFNIAWIVGGALLIAVAASILPARRAARLKTVEALRFDM